MTRMVSDYEVVAVDPATGENVWVSIGSREAAEWKAGVMPDGQHARFVQKPSDRATEVDWDAKPVLMWAGMQTLEQSPVGRRVMQRQVRTSRDPHRRWFLEDRKTEAVTRLYTLDEVVERVRKRSWATLGRKKVVDTRTGGEWRARDVYAYGGEALLEWATRLEQQQEGLA